MAEAIPQLDPAADAGDEIGADSASVTAPATDTGSGGPSGQPRAMKKPEDVIRSLQSENDRVKSRYGKLLSSDYAKRLGGDGILQSLAQYEAVLSHPETLKLLNEHLRQTPNGSWEFKPPALKRAAEIDAEAGVTGGTGDPYADDPLLKQFEARLDAKLSPLVERLTSLQARSDTALAAGGEQKVSEMIRRFKAQYPYSQEEAADVSAAISERISRLDPTVLLKMTDEQFEEYIGLPAVKKFLPSIIARKAKQRGSALADLATDASGAPSLGADTASAGKPKPGETWQQMQKRIAAIAERVAREPA